MYLIKSRINIKGGELIQNQYITNNFIVSEINSQKHIYIPGNNLFQIDDENKILKVVDLSSQMEQINRIKTMLGEIKSEELLGTKEILGMQSKGMKFYNDSDTMKFEMDSHIIAVSGIKNTVYSDFIKDEQSKQIVQLNLNPNEIIGFMSTKIYSNGTLLQEQTVNILNIEKDLDDVEEFYDYLTYSYE